MSKRFSHTISALLATVKRIPSRTAMLVALFVLAMTVLFAARPDALQIGAATATLPRAAETEEAEAPQTPEQRIAARIGITHEAIDLSSGTIDTRKLTPLPPQELTSIDDETLWLARCVYSETKRPEEMELVAWTIRNRVETRYRGKNSYRDVVLDPYQFSAFNRNSGKRNYFTGLTTQSHAEKWSDALTIARIVKNAPASLRPFSRETRHYYSQRSMVGGRKPAWAAGQKPVTPNRPFQLEAQRFRFFENVS